MAHDPMRQRRDALQEANRRRAIRAALKREAAADPMLRPIIAVLDGSAAGIDALDGIRVGELLLAAQGIGPAKVRRIMREAGVSRGPAVRVRELAAVQRHALAGALATYAAARARRLGLNIDTEENAA